MAEPSSVGAATAEKAAGAAGAEAKEQVVNAAATDAAAAGEEQEQDAPPLEVSIYVPNCNEPLKISLMATDTVQELRQWVAELPSSQYITCIALEFEGKRLPEFAQLSQIPNLQNGSVLRVVKDSYTDRSMRFHVRRIRELLSCTNPETLFQPSPLTQEHLSPAVLPSLLRHAAEEEIHEVLTKPWTAPLSSTYTPITSTMPIECLHSLTFSAWNPPSQARAMFGDLAYLSVHTLENRTYHITAHTQGFYVNKSTDTVFDPHEHASFPSNCHDLISLLRAVSAKFSTQFMALTKEIAGRHLFEMTSSFERVQQWLLPELPVRPNHSRAEEAALATSECDPSSPGLVRDWNNDLQEIRELPTNTRQQRLFRDRLLTKLNSDFIAASVRGAQAIVHGNVQAIDPSVEFGQRMFLWNNIFFSFAVDSRDLFKTQGGNAAAHAASAADLRGVTAVLQAGVEGLSVLATAIVDYAGHRLIAQAILPGIIRRDASHSIIHGSLEPGAPVVVDAKCNELLGKVAEALHMRPHKIRNADGSEVALNGSAEFKCMKGTDDRLYLLDLFRTTPRDPKFVLNEAGDNVRHNVYTFRPELVSSYYEQTLMIGIREQVAQQQAKEKEAKQSATAEPASASDTTTTAATTTTTTTDTASAVATTGSSGAESDKAENPAEEKPARFEVDLSAIKTFEFNPDTLTPVEAADTEEEKQKDQKCLSDLSNFLTGLIIPRFLADLADGRMTLIDGTALTQAMHNRGINMRYLGLMLQRLEAFEGCPDFPKKLLLLELLSRVAKFHLRAVLAEAPKEWTSVCIAHFLNCYFGNVTAAPDWPQFAEARAHGFGASKKRAAKACPPSSIAEMTSASLWAAMQKTAQLHFQYTLRERKTLTNYFTTGKVALLRSLCLKTGVQLFARDYPLGLPLPFNPADIAGLVPVIKSLAPSSADALALHERGAMELSKGNLQGFALIDEAASLFVQVHGSVHPSVAACLRILAQLHYQRDEVSPGLELMERATIAYERACGVDSADLVTYLTMLAKIYEQSSASVRALVCLHHARHIIERCFGDDHPEITGIDQNIATVLLKAGKSEAALALFRINTAAFEGRATRGLELGLSYELMARAAHDSKDARSAVNYQRKAITELERLVSAEDPHLQQAKANLSAYTKEAVQAEILKKQQAPLHSRAAKTTSKSSRFVPDTRPVSELLDFINGVTAPKSKPAKKKKAKAPAESATTAAV